MEKRSSRPRRVAASSYPVPSPEDVSEIQRKLFSGRFVDDHLSALLGRASVAISEEFHEDVRLSSAAHSTLARSGDAFG